MGVRPVAVVVMNRAAPGEAAGTSLAYRTQSRREVTDAMLR